LRSGGLSGNHNGFPIFLLLGFYCALGGCATYKNVPVDTSRESLQVAKIPLRAGLYLSESFRQYSYGFHAIDQVIYMEDRFMKFGESLTKISKDVVGKAFTSHVVIERLDHLTDLKDVDVIVIPEIYYIKAMRYSLNSVALVRIKWTIKDVHENIHFVDTFTSDIKENERGDKGFFRACSLAMADQYKKTLVGITKYKWWEHVNRRVQCPPQ